MQRLKLLVFHQYLAPYRIDFWNSLNDLFNLRLYFLHKNVIEQKFDQEVLKRKLNFECFYYLRGFLIGRRSFRYGFLKTINEYSPDVIIGYEYSQTILTCLILKAIFRFNYKVYTLCDDSLDIAVNCGGLRRIARSFALKHLDGIITVNDDVSSWYDNNFKLKSPCITFPIVAKESVFQNDLKNVLFLSNQLIKKHNLKGKKIVFYVGRLVDVKNVNQLIKAFKEIANNQKKSLLVIIGGGTEEKFLHHLVNSFGIGKQVIFTGRIEGDELYAWYNLGQLFVLPSYYEPFGAVVSEALMAGASVLCSSYSGSSCLINRNNGALFNPYNLADLVRLLDKHLNGIVELTDIAAIRPSKNYIKFDTLIDNLYKHLVHSHS